MPSDLLNTDPVENQQPLEIHGGSEHDHGGESHPNRPLRKRFGRWVERRVDAARRTTAGINYILKEQGIRLKG